MADSMIRLSDLKTGDCTSSVRARILRLWEVRSSRRGGELMRLELILVDISGNMMLAKISAGRLSLFRSKLIPGLIYSISMFEVARCVQSSRHTGSPMEIRFGDSTELEEMTDPDSVMPGEGFRFCDMAELLRLANTNTRFPDVVAQITAVRSTVRDPLKGKNHVMATIMLEDGGSLVLSLFDAQAISFHRRIQSMSVGPRVVVATNIKPRMVGGRMFLNATTGTHIYFDCESIPGEKRYQWLSVMDSGIHALASSSREVTRVENVTIAELNIFAIHALSKEIEFMCVGRVTQVDYENGWCYVACSRCSSELKRNMSGFTCVRCHCSTAVGVLRYRVGFSIADDTAEGVFVCFDGALTKLHKLEAQDAGQLLVGKGVNPEDSPIPPFIAGMYGKTYTFHARSTTCTGTSSRQPFIITHISGDHESLQPSGLNCMTREFVDAVCMTAADSDPPEPKYVWSSGDKPSETVM